MAYGNYAPFYRTGYFNPIQPQLMNNMPMQDNSAPFNPNFQPQMQPATPNITPPTAQTPQMSNDMIWVQGLAGAKAYLVAPNTTVTLWDSESETIYLKSCDANGMPSMKILDIKERIETPSKLPSNEGEQPTKGFALADDLKAVKEEFDGKYEELKDKVNRLLEKPATKTKKSEE